MILITDPADIIGQQVSHRGERVGMVTEIRPNMQNGRRYAFVQSYYPGDDERRLPLDELEIFPSTEVRA